MFGGEGLLNTALSSTCLPPGIDTDLSGTGFNLVHLLYLTCVQQTLLSVPARTTSLSVFDLERKFVPCPWHM